ncbi:MAG: hypothetical protein A2Y38_16605 [Spirochaetes bacterium GWB1_59_5]|nr:MAG: hypothetical protein A2Y38_16605 [Spirochaetes bacterium GWB1_59_5]
MDKSDLIETSNVEDVERLEKAVEEAAQGEEVFALHLDAGAAATVAACTMIGWALIGANPELISRAMHSQAEREAMRQAFTIIQVTGLDRDGVGLNVMQAVGQLCLQWIAKVKPEWKREVERRMVEPILTDVVIAEGGN